MTAKTLDITKLVQRDDASPTAAERDELKRLLADKLRTLSAQPDATPLERARLQLDVAEVLHALQRSAETWELAREAFITALQENAWADAVEACDVLFQSGQAEAKAALGMGVWLAVTFPVDPELTLAMLIHVVDEMPDTADAAAVAAITARYVVDLRASDERHEDLSFLADRLIATVAQRHGNVQDQAAMDRWLDRLALRDPQLFLPRLAGVVDQLVAGRWWFDRDVLRASISC